MASLFRKRHDHKEAKETKEIKEYIPEHPLNQKFFTDMLKNEIELSSRKFTYSTIENLVLLYAKAIEYYDSIKDPISLYFQEKIQLTLASKESLKMILHTEMNQDPAQPPGQKKEINFQRLDSTIIQKEKKKEEDGYDSGDDAIDDMVNSASLMRNRLDRYSLSKARAERAKEVDRYIKVETQKITAKKNITTLLDDYVKLAVTNDKTVTKNLDNQIDNIKQRREKKKYQEFLSKTMDKTLNATFDVDPKQLFDESFIIKQDANKRNNTLLEEGFSRSGTLNSIQFSFYNQNSKNFD